MSLQKQQDFLARLFTDECLRQNFLSEPKKIGLANGLSDTDITELQTVLPEQLTFFADSLYWKRLREVEKFLPMTKTVLGENFKILFREFSQIYNPTSVKKHLEDAIEFCKTLQTKKLELVYAKDIAKFEQGKLEFHGCGKPFVWKMFNYNIKEILRNPRKSNLNKRITLTIWLKIGGKIKHFWV
jgi:hypothetical protein